MSDIDVLTARARAFGVTRTYALGDVPPSPGYPYAVLSLSTGRPGTVRGGGDTTRTTPRLVAKVYARTHGVLLDTAGALDDAFKGRVLTALPGKPLCVREDLDAQPYRDPDDSGVLNLIQTYKLMEG